MTARLLTGLAAALGVAAPAFASGGYFPSEWGLLLLAFALVLFATAATAERLALGRLDAALLGALAALAGWQLLSIAWSSAPDGPVLEAERTLIYVAATAALLLGVPRERLIALLGGLVAGTVAVALAGLGERLVAGDLGDPADPVSGIRLNEPIGYANAIAILAVLGGLAAAALALRSGVYARAAASAALVPLAAAFAFTFSRGAVVALAAGLLAVLALEWERGRALAGLLVLAAAPAAAAALALGSPLADAATTSAQADAAGERLLWQLALLSGAGAAAGVFVGRAARALAPYAVGLAILGVVAAGMLALVAGPQKLADGALDRLRAEPVVTGSDVPGRLLSLSSSGRTAYWHVARQMVEREPLLGEGAGSYERWWLHERPVASYARDAHNLYLETLAELGPVGLALLLAALGAPLAALRRHARHPAVPVAGGAYCAFLVHAGLDWDWEIPSVTLAGLACGASLVVLARPRESARAWNRGTRAAGLALATVLVGVALVAHVGNRAVAASEDALARGEPGRAAADARRARTWQPWAAAPLRLLGEAELAAGHDAAAAGHLRASLRRDPESWHAWYDLAVVSAGRGRAAALDRARALNPRGPEVAELQTDS